MTEHDPRSATDAIRLSRETAYVHWVNEGRLPTAEDKSAEDCLRHVDKSSLIAALHAGAGGRAADPTGEASDLGDDLVRRLVPADRSEQLPHAG